MDARKQDVVFALFTIISLLLFMEVMVNPVAEDVAPADPLFPAMFVFGDSLLDPGNAVAAASSSSSSYFHIPLFLSTPNHPPYGRDLPSHLPTGRYSNGLLLSDFLAQLMGLPYPPPYLAHKDDFMKGTSFAFGGAVIINTRRAFFQNPDVEFHDQVSFFKDVHDRISTSIGDDDADDLISKSLFLICIGANDYFTNYTNNRLRRIFAQQRYTLKEFTEALISSYRQNILDLYDMGARKFALVSLPPIGCTPFILLLFLRSNNTTCIDFINDEVKDFNALLLKMSIELQDAYPSAHFTYLNAYDETLNIIEDPTSYGFIDTSKPCCALGPYGGVPLCSTEISKICNDASQYVFWDYVHPTERACSLAANWFLQGSTPYVQPFNLQQLSAL